MFSSYLEHSKLDPQKMSQVQYTETERAFHAGVAATLAILIESADETEEVAVKVIDLLYTEAEDFWKKQKK